MLTSVDRLLFVRAVPIFTELRDDFLVRLASIMDELSFPANHAIFREGEEGRSLYIVVSGRVRVHLRSQELTTLEKGTCFGEMSLFDAEPRSASITTLNPCDCLVLTQQQMYEAIEETPGIAVNIIRMLSRRIREINKELNRRQSSSNQPTKLSPGLQDALQEVSATGSLTDNVTPRPAAQPVRPVVTASQGQKNLHESPWPL
ncbi:Crp/Fnr family transcriptional regulator [Leptothoe sp. PORK10 BA2]|uniref:Crp/Fnr family transcriptional regulator n=1 Tax=Leptothoe sp. PORK10 BA2 TaxID=3110254 RepID=UPI002B219080|nr:cyclic nucleotide-binding domain-containing protein [Leptothoe sp. PORK10 BA2]MEA5463698.1 cyclic nucleotide-binding domain-containing protein [Leptothoe sp. PORK10 BA2]